MTETDSTRLSEDARLVLRELQSEPDHAMAQPLPHGLPAAERARRIERASGIARELVGHGVRLVQRGSPDGEVLALVLDPPGRGRGPAAAK